MKKRAFHRRKWQEWQAFGSLFNWRLLGVWAFGTEASFIDDTSHAFAITAHQRDGILDRLSLAGRTE